MATGIKNQKAKGIQAMKEAYEMGIRGATIHGSAEGMRALAKLVVEKIDKGYSLEQIKKYCENIDEVYGKK